MYEGGRGVAKDDAEAVKWWRKAAEQGVATCQNKLGVMYGNGRGGLPKDDQQAVEWYSRAAKQGDATAQGNLGKMYETGRGVAKDEAEAAKWYRKAADQGDARAQAYLGRLYRDGRGVSRTISRRLSGSARRPTRAMHTPNTLLATCLKWDPVLPRTMRRQ